MKSVNSIGGEVNSNSMFQNFKSSNEKEGSEQLTSPVECSDKGCNDYLFGQYTLSKNKENTLYSPTFKKSNIDDTVALKKILSEVNIQDRPCQVYQPDVWVKPFFIKMRECFARITEGVSNNVYSPVSQLYLMAAFYFGADGETKKEFKQFLGIESDQEFLSQLQKMKRELCFDRQQKFLGYMNEIYLGRSQPNFSSGLKFSSITAYDRDFLFSSTFFEKIKQLFDGDISIQDATELFSLDFQQQLNKEVFEFTQGQAQKVLTEPLPDYTRFVCLSMVFLELYWSESFINITNKLPFHSFDGSVNHINYMSFESYCVSKDICVNGVDMQAAWLPFRDPSIGVILMQPKDKQAVLNNTLSNAAGDVYQKLQRQAASQMSADSEKQPLKTIIPNHLKIHSRWNLIEALKGELKTPFTQGVANFDNMMKIQYPQSPFVSFMMQDTYIEWNHNRVKASAVTVGAASLISFNGFKGADLRFDHPFEAQVFDLRKGIPLFAATIINNQAFSRTASGD